MCRSIVSLRGVPVATPDEVEAAARQFVRKVSGTKAKTPSKANQEAFDLAIAEIAHATSHLLSAWVVSGPPAPRPPAAGAAAAGVSPSGQTRARSGPRARPATR